MRHRPDVCPERWIAGGGWARTSVTRGRRGRGGVLSVDEHGTYLTVVLASSRVDVWPSDYMLGWDEHCSGTEAAPVFEQVPRYLDLLIDRRGFKEHPGDIMSNWRYDNPWD